VENVNSDNVSILRNRGKGRFRDPQNFRVGATPFGLASGDFDENGGDDLATANFNSDDVSVLLNARDCANGGGGNGGGGGGGDNDKNGNGKGKNSNRPPFFVNPFSDQYNDEDDFDEDEEDLNEGEDLDEDQYDDEGGDEDEDGPVNATSEDGQAEASTPGATARAGGDPDDLEPETEVPDDVEDEIPTSGPLPNTDGVSLLVLAISTALSVGGLVAFWAVVVRRAEV
jgi:hypothetical protein